MHKEIFVVPGHRFAVDFCSGEPKKDYGEKIPSIFRKDSYYINFPASPAEAEMYFRELEYREGPVRIRYHMETRIGGLDDPEFVQVEVPDYKPNRHQRKRPEIWKLIEKLEGKA